MRYFSIVLVFILFFGSSFAYSQEAKAEAAKPTFSLVSVLPQRTLFVAGTQNIMQAKAALKKTNLYKLLKNKEATRFLKPALDKLQPKIEKFYAKFKRKMGLEFHEVLNIPSGEVLAAVVDLDMADRRLPLGFVVSMQVGKSQKALFHLLNLAQKMGRMKFTKKVVHGFDVYEMPGVPFAYAIIGETFLFTSKQYLMKELLDMHVKEEKKDFLFRQHMQKKFSVLLLLKRKL